MGALGLLMMGMQRVACGGVGDVDPAYGNGGQVAVDEAPADLVGTNSLLPLDDGRVLWPAGTAYRRLDPTGHADAAFGTPDWPAHFRPNWDAWLRLSDGSTLLGGEEFIASQAGSARSSAAVIRLDPSGRIDATFAGRGMLVAEPLALTASRVMALALQADGRLLVLTREFDYFYFYGTWEMGGGNSTAWNVVVRRFDRSLQSDASFGVHGAAVAYGAPNNGLESVAGLPRGPDGAKLTVLDGGIIRIRNESYDHISPAPTVYLRYLEADGSAVAQPPPRTALDPSIRDWQIVKSLPDGGVLMDGMSNGNSSTHYKLTRLLADGRPDAAFAEGGSFVLDDTRPTTGSRSHVSADGRFLYLARESSNAVSVARIVLDGVEAGHLDDSFGDHGITHIGAPLVLMALQGAADGSLLLVARHRGDGGRHVFRLLATPAPSPGIISFERSATMLVSRPGRYQLRVTRSAGSSGPISVDFNLAALADPPRQAPVPAQDYLPQEGQLGWADGEKGSKSVVLTLLPSFATQSRGPLEVRLGNPVGVPWMPYASVQLVGDQDPLYSTLSETAPEPEDPAPPPPALPQGPAAEGPPSLEGGGTVGPQDHPAQMGGAGGIDLAMLVTLGLLAGICARKRLKPVIRRGPRPRLPWRSAVVVCGMLPWLAAEAGTGDMDPSYGMSGYYGSGTAVWPQPAPYSGMDGPIVLTDGRMIVLNAESGALYSRRVGLDGRIDPGFAGSGSEKIPLTWGVRSTATGIDGRSFIASGNGFPAIARLRADGLLDSAFGNGGIADVKTGSGRAELEAVAALGDGGAVALWVQYGLREGGCATDVRLVRVGAAGQVLGELPVNPDLFNFVDCAAWLGGYETGNAASMRTLAGDLIQLVLPNTVLFYRAGSSATTPPLMAIEPPASLSGARIVGADAEGDFAVRIPPASGLQLRLLRLHADLGIDSSFGTAEGGGVVVDLAQAPGVASTWSIDGYSTSVFAGDPQFIYMAAQLRQQPGYYPHAAIIVRLLRDGRVDTGFGSGGFAMVRGGTCGPDPYSESGGCGRVVGAQAGGKALVQIGGAVLRTLGQPAPSPGVLDLRFAPATFTQRGYYPIQSHLGVPENSNAVVEVTRTMGSAGQVSVNYRIRPDTATAGLDYVDVAGTLVWADGESGVRRFTVPIAADTLAEPTELFDVVIEPAGPAVVLNRSTQYAILDSNGGSDVSPGPPPVAPPGSPVPPPTPPTGPDAASHGESVSGAGSIDGAWLAVWVLLLATTACRRLKVAGRCGITNPLRPPHTKP